MNDTSKVSVSAEESFRPFARITAREAATKEADGNEKGMFTTFVCALFEYDGWA